MDIISYGVASKANKQEKDTRNEILGQGIEGIHPNVKTRIDALEKGIQGVVKQADKLIIQDAINIMKANAKLNAVAKTKKYNMYNMVFDDLLDLNGIDTAKSSGYTHNATEGLVTANKNCVLETKEEVVDNSPSKVILTVEEDSPKDDLNQKGAYFISRDNGETWESVTPDTLFYFKDSISPHDNKLKMKAELPSGTKLLNYALTWA